MQISKYIKYLQHGEEELATTFKTASEFHVHEPDVHEMCKLFSSWSLAHVQNLTPMLTRYGEGEENDPYRINYSWQNLSTASLRLLSDLQLLSLMAKDVQIGWTVLQQCAKALRDEQLKLSCMQFSAQTKQQEEWLIMKIKHSAPQILTVAT